MSKQPQTTAQQQPPSNFLLFVALVLLMFFSWQQIKNSIWPPDPVKPGADKVEDEKGKGPLAAFVLPDQPDPAKDELLSLGDDSGGSAFNLRVRLSPRGAGLRSVTLNKFNAATDDGRPAEGRLDLVPDKANEAEPAHLLFHYAPDKPNDERPLDTLGKAVWEVVKVAGKPVSVGEVNGKAVHSVAFRARVAGVEITKTYSLREGDYHLGLEVELHRPADKGKKGDDPLAFRYQLTGAKGLPVEGKWYAGVFRNCYVGVEDGTGRIVTRDYQDLPRISWSGGGTSVRPGQGAFIRYAGVAVQHFASVIAVEGKNPSFLQSARPTLEAGVLHG
ncbi:MAG: YidC/Oxa1 family insertase periplasmic-domain containing protein, partial [Gemmataceae bacterium]|nr:YidC/Oxa1 family insertase periplasmic-domain containing protein [Gemmataceae bacterium]